MISEKQYKLLKEYLIPNLPQGQSKTFHELARLNLINAVCENGKELYVITNKGLAEVENRQEKKKESIISYIALSISIISLIAAFVFEFVF